MLRNSLLTGMLLTSLLAPGCTLRPDAGEPGDDVDLGRVRDGGPKCVGLQCQVAKCRGGAHTTVSGVVTIPAGKLRLPS